MDYENMNYAELAWNRIQLQVSMLAIQSIMWNELLFRGSRSRQSYMWSGVFFHRSCRQFCVKYVLKLSSCTVTCEMSSCTEAAESSVWNEFLHRNCKQFRVKWILAQKLQTVPYKVHSWAEFLYSYVWSEFLHRRCRQSRMKYILELSCCTVTCEVSSCTKAADSSVWSTFLSWVLVQLRVKWVLAQRLRRVPCEVRSCTVPYEMSCNTSTHVPDPNSVPCQMGSYTAFRVKWIVIQTLQLQKNSVWNEFVFRVSSPKQCFVWKQLLCNGSGQVCVNGIRAQKLQTDFRVKRFLI
jgi:hypothetical protein